MTLNRVGFHFVQSSLQHPLAAGINGVIKEYHEHFRQLSTGDGCFLKSRRVTTWS
jgi:hypothetical protein